MARFRNKRTGEIIEIRDEVAPDLETRQPAQARPTAFREGTTAQFLPGEERTEAKIDVRTRDLQQGAADLGNEFINIQQKFKQNPLAAALEFSTPVQAGRAVGGLSGALADEVKRAREMSPLERIKEGLNSVRKPVGTGVGSAIGFISQALNNSELGRIGLGIADQAFSRAEAALANPLLDIQAGNADASSFIQSFGRGLAGRRTGEIGDVLRKQLLDRKIIGSFKIPDGLAEGVSSTGGLLAMLGVFKAMDAIARGGKAKLLGNRKFLINEGNKAVGAVKNTLKEYQGQYQHLYGQIDDVALNNRDARRLVKILDDNLTPSVRKEVIGDVLTPTGRLRKTIKIKKVREVRQLLSEQTPQSAWVNAQKQKNIRFSTKKMRDAVTKIKEDIIFSKDPAGRHIYMNEDLAKQIRAIDPIYTELKRTGKGITDTLVDANGNLKTKGVVSAFTNADAAGKRDIFSRFSKYSTEMAEFNKAMDKFAFRRILTRRAVATGIGVGAGLATGGIIRAIRESGGGSVSNGGGGG